MKILLLASEPNKINQTLQINTNKCDNLLNNAANPDLEDDCSDDIETIVKPVKFLIEQAINEKNFQFSEKKLNSENDNNNLEQDGNLSMTNIDYNQVLTEFKLDLGNFSLPDSSFYSTIKEDDNQVDCTDTWKENQNIDCLGAESINSDKIARTPDKCNTNSREFSEANVIHMHPKHQSTPLPEHKSKKIVSKTKKLIADDSFVAFDDDDEDFNELITSNFCSKNYPAKSINDHCTKVKRKTSIQFLGQTKTFKVKIPLPKIRLNILRKMLLSYEQILSVINCQLT